MPRINSAKQKQLTATSPDNTKERVIDRLSAIPLQTLDNPNPFGLSANDYFGGSIGISGDRCIVGAFLEDDAGGADSGKAYIFDVTTGNLLHTLDNPNDFGTSASDRFGTSVAISGDRCIVGAPREDDAVGGADSGRAYIFSVTTGELLHTLDNPDPVAGDYFGLTVAISGDRCLVGVPNKADGANTDSGRVYIYDVTTGGVVHTLNNPNAFGTSAGDVFGNSLAIDGDRCIIGAYAEDDGDIFVGTISGKAYIFDVTTGNLLHTLDNPNPFGDSYLDGFGWSVAISGDRCIVGAYGEATSSGKAYIFSVTDGSLLHTLDNPNAAGTAPNDQFGTSVAISGDRCMVGAWLEDEVASASGTAYIFSVTNGALLRTLSNPNDFNTSAGDRFGNQVAIDGNRWMAAAYLEDDALGTGSGKVYIGDPAPSLPAVSVSAQLTDDALSLGAGMNLTQGGIFCCQTLADQSAIVIGNFGRYNGTSVPYMMKILPNGELDTDFLTNMGTGPNTFIGYLNGLAIQSDGKIVIGGNISSFNGVAQGRVTRVNADGSLDTDFAANNLGFNAGIEAVAIQSDGKILVGGVISQWDPTGTPVSVYRMARLNADGSLDGTYLPSSAAIPNSIVTGIAVQSDGKAVVIGSFTTWDGVTVGCIVRLNTDGTRDTTFQTNVGTGFTTWPQTIRHQSDGKLVIVGRFSQFNGNSRGGIVRLNADGTEDTTFATNTGTGFSVGANSRVEEVHIQSDGKILCGLQAGTTFDGTAVSNIVRLNADGTLDTAFNTAIGLGIQTASNSEEVFAISSYSSGDILLGGRFQNFDGQSARGIVRLNSDGSLKQRLNNGDEGSSYTFNIKTDNVRAGTLLRWRILDRPEDFTTSTGTVTVQALDGDSAVATLPTYVSEYDIAADPNTQGLFFRDDGTQMWVTATNTDRTYEYALGTAWDVTTATLTSNWQATNGSGINLDGNPQQIFFHPEGTRMFLLTLTNPRIYEFALTTPWDISTAPTPGVIVNQLDLNPLLTNQPTGMYFSPDGLNLYVSSNNPVKEIRQYALSSAWDITTATYTQSLATSSDILGPYGVTFRPDGTKMYTVCWDANTAIANKNVFEYSLSTAWDISTATYVGSFRTLYKYPKDIVFRPTGTEFFVLGNEVAKYSSPEAWSVTKPVNGVSFTVTPTADLLTEGPETFRVEISKLTGTVMAISSSVTINDTSTSTLSISADAADVDEGSTVTFTVTVDSQNLPDGTTLYWTVDNTADVTVSSGSFEINSDQGQFVVTALADFVTEGSETFTASVRSGSVAGNVIITSDPVTINDVSVETYAVSPAANNVDEGSALSFTVTTQGVPNDTTLYWTVTNTGDFGTSSGSFTITDDSGTFEVTPSLDGTAEGAETFTASVRTGSISGTVVATSASVTINDTSNTPIYNITPAAGSVNEGSSLLFTVTTAGVANGTTLYWTVTQAEEFDFSSGSFTINSNSGTFSVKPAADLVTDGAMTFTASVRTGSVSGTVVATSSNVTINDTSKTVTLLRTHQAEEIQVDGFYGGTVAINDTYYVISAPWRDVGGTADIGRAWQYNLSTGALVRTFNTGNTSSFRRFGTTMCMNSTHVFIGHNFQGLTDCLVYGFNLETGNADFTFGPGFDGPMSCNDDYLVIGYPYTADPNQAGTVRVFDLNDSGNLAWQTNNPNQDTGSQGAVADLFGWSVDITQDNRVVVGAVGADQGALTGAGFVYILDTEGAVIDNIPAPSVSGSTNIGNDQWGNRSRWRTTSRGDIIVSSAFTAENSGTNSIGHATAYEYNGASTADTVLWSARPNNPQAGDLYGINMAANNRFVAIGKQVGTTGGGVELRDLVTGNLVATINNPNTGTRSIADAFGGQQIFYESIAMSDTHIIIGAAYEDNPDGTTRAGVAYVYKLID